MASALQGLHALIVLVVVAVYTGFMLKAMNKQFAHEINTNLNREYEKNPILKEDVEKYREQLSQEEEKKKHLEALEQEQQNIAAKIEELKAKAYPTLKRLQEQASKGDSLRTKYVQMSGVTVEDEVETRGSFQDTSKKKAQPSLKRSGHRAKAHNEF